MKLVRFGSKGFERPGIIAADGTIRDLSHVVADITGAALRPEGLERIARVDPDDLPRAPDDARLGSCIAMPYNFVAIGLNSCLSLPETRSDHGSTWANFWEKTKRSK